MDRRIIIINKMATLKKEQDQTLTVDLKRRVFHGKNWAVLTAIFLKYASSVLIIWIMMSYGATEGIIAAATGWLGGRA